MKNLLCLDVETTTLDTGSPFNPDNRLCSVGLGTTLVNTYDIEYSHSPYKDQLSSICDELHGADLLVGFNIKFDLHWLRRYGILPKPKTKLWDVQLAFFIMTGQNHPYPSLAQVAEHYGLPGKMDKIKQYWDDGIDTPDIPWWELDEYLKQDVSLTYQLFQIQSKEVSAKQLKNILRASTDLLMTGEMEWNGLLYDKELSIARGDVLDAEAKSLQQELVDEYAKILPLPINWNSNTQLSKVLYGGELEETIREPYEYTYKSGARQGITATRYKIAVVKHMAPRLYDPLPKSETAKEGVFKTDEGTLLSIKTKNPLARFILDRVTYLAKLQKKLNTYFYGIPQKMEEKG